MADLAALSGREALLISLFPLPAHAHIRFGRDRAMAGSRAGSSPSDSAATCPPNQLSQTRSTGRGFALGLHMPLARRQIEPDTAIAPQEDWRLIASALTSYVRKRTHRHDVVEDIVQETVLRLIDYRKKGPLVSAYALAFRIAGNLVIDRFRAERRYAAEAADEPASPTALPDRVLAGRQELALLMQALQAMPPLRREVIIRRRLHGQSCATIAKELDLNPKAVEKHITRGLVDLNKARIWTGLVEPHQS